MLLWHIYIHIQISVSTQKRKNNVYYLEIKYIQYNVCKLLTSSLPESTPRGWRHCTRISQLATDDICIPKVPTVVTDSTPATSVVHQGCPLGPGTPSHEPYIPITEGVTHSKNHPEQAHSRQHWIPHDDLGNIEISRIIINIQYRQKRSAGITTVTGCCDDRPFLPSCRLLAYWAQCRVTDIFVKSGACTIYWRDYESARHLTHVNGKVQWNLRLMNSVGKYDVYLGIVLWDCVECIRTANEK